MDKNEFIEKITEIGTCEDDAQRRTLLASLQGDVESVFDENQTKADEITSLKEKNEKLEDANYEMFLQISKKAPEEKKKGEQKEKLSFDDLFDEKGELK